MVKAAACKRASNLDNMITSNELLLSTDPLLYPATTLAVSTAHPACVLVESWKAAHVSCCSPPAAKRDEPIAGCISTGKSLDAPLVR